MLIEKYDSIVPVEKLEERMKKFFLSGYDAFWALHKNTKSGYILINRTVLPMYIKQLFIFPDFQRKGLRSYAIKRIKEIYNTDTLDVEVMIWNEVGFNFWKKMGFKTRCFSMRLKDYPRFDKNKNTLD